MKISAQMRFLRDLFTTTFSTKLLSKLVLRSCLKLIFTSFRILKNEKRVDFFNMFLNEFEMSLNKVGFRTRLRLEPLADQANSEIAKSMNNFGIVIQGPINSISELQQVQNTIIHYANTFPGMKIVLSTWHNSLRLSDDFEQIEDFYEVRTLDPGPSKPSNLQRQITSTHLGLEVLSGLGADFIAIKTRTDQRITNPISLQYIERKLSASIIPRVWTTDFGTGRYRIYGLSDQLQFGYISEMNKFWHDDGLEQKISRITGVEIREPTDLHFLSLGVHEILLVCDYLIRIGHIPAWTWDDYLFCLNNYFGIASSETIGVVSFSRLRNPIDHVLPGMPQVELEINRHLSEVEWELICNGCQLQMPSSKLLLAAMKVPNSDLPFINHIWSKKQ